MSDAAPTLDYDVAGVIDVSSRDQLVDALRSDPGAPRRLIGSGSHQDRVPAPATTPTLIRTASMNRIERLEAEDLTCSVQPGVTRAALDAALAERGLWLPCPGAGTLAGMFAADLHAPLAPGALAPRSLLLGIEGVLAEGLAFKSGARVVKSVAGFDLQKLFVGSLGRLFAVTTLHLRLRPLPRAVVAFAAPGLDDDRALALFTRSRQLASPPLELWLQRDDQEYTVRGALAGHADHVAAELRSLQLQEAADAGARSLGDVAARETVTGRVRPSHLPRLLAALPVDAPLLVNGTGQFEVAMTPEQTDAMFSRCPEVPADLMVLRGAPGRRGLSTAPDPHAARLDAKLREAMDPAGALQ